jgi:glycosyltransferase involved in cell wall biosynthesis
MPRREWGISQDAFCVLFCGKFIAKKRPLDLVRAAASLRMSGRLPEIHLLFAGAGELGQDLRSATHPVFDAEPQAQASPDVRSPLDCPPASFAGFLNQTEISRAYVAADCLVLPSDHDETWGLVVNEAMASGLPCIVSDACGCAEDMIEPQWRFPVGDVAALAERLLALRNTKGAVPARPLPGFEALVGTVAQVYTAIAATR